MALADVQERLLADVWYGLQLTHENLDALDAHKPGNPTFRRRIPGRHPALDLMHPLVSTSFDWTARRDNDSDQVKRLYIREFLPKTDRAALLVAVTNRELHAERNTVLRQFSHADGKVRRYPTDSYGIDHDTPLEQTGPHSHSRKLWRVDGPISDEEWGELVGLYFRDNELVAEYFRAVFPTVEADAEAACRDFPRPA